MKKESSVLQSAGEVFGFAKEYLEKRIELYQVLVAEQLIKITSSLTIYFLLFEIAKLILLFASISAGFFLAEALESNGWGFLIVAGFYLLLAILLYVFRRPLIINPVLNIIINLFKEDETDEGEQEAPASVPPNQQNTSTNGHSQGNQDGQRPSPVQETAAQ